MPILYVICRRMSWVGRRISGYSSPTLPSVSLLRVWCTRYFISRSNNVIGTSGKATAKTQTIECVHPLSVLAGSWLMTRNGAWFRCWCRGVKRLKTKTKSTYKGWVGGHSRASSFGACCVPHDHFLKSRSLVIKIRRRQRSYHEIVHAHILS